MDNNNWHWQEKGTAWYGIGIYHVTLVVPSREPLLGKLIIPENDPKQAIIERTNLGNALVEKLLAHPSFYPEIRILQFCLMPDHLHAILYVTQPMDTSIRSVVHSLWQGAKKLGKAYSLSLAPESDSGTNNKE
jgi:REP element-mobilizing transposase RayT